MLVTDERAEITWYVEGRKAEQISTDNSGQLSQLMVAFLESLLPWVHIPHDKDVDIYSNKIKLF